MEGEGRLDAFCCDWKNSVFSRVKGTYSGVFLLSCYHVLYVGLMSYGLIP